MKKRPMLMLMDRCRCYSQYVFFVGKTLRKSLFFIFRRIIDISMEELCLKFNLKDCYSSGLVLVVDSGSKNHSHTWIVMVFVVLYVFIVAFRGISKEENPKMKPKARFCGLTICFTLLPEWKKISYAFRNYWAHYTKETKTTFKTAFTFHKCTKCWPVWSSPLWPTENFYCLLTWVGFWITCTNNVCDVCQHFCLRHHWKFMNTLCNVFCLNHRTMKKKTQLLQKLLMRTMIILR